MTSVLEDQKEQTTTDRETIRHSLLHRVIDLLFARFDAPEPIEEDDQWQTILKETQEAAIREFEKGNQEVYEFYQRTRMSE